MLYELIFSFLFIVFAVAMFLSLAFVAAGTFVYLLLGLVIYHRMRVAHPEARLSITEVNGYDFCIWLRDYIVDGRFETSPIDEFRTFCRRTQALERAIKRGWVILAITFVLTFVTRELA